LSRYVAPWWLPGGHLQTIYGSLFPPPRVPLHRARWRTPDGDFIDIDFAGASGAARTVVLFHGLEGSSDSHYARALAAAVLDAGSRIAIAHFRGCSGEPNQSARAYHSGDSAEVDWVVKRLRQESPDLSAVGVSLGGNVLLKWLGEQGEAAKHWLRSAAAVSAPLDLPASARTLDRGLNRLLYTRHFLATLKPKSLAKLDRFPGIYDAARVRAAVSFREFDDLVTAPVHGFRDADHYWSTASCGPWLERIRVPTLVLNARNDPFLPEAALVAAARAAAPCVTLEFPATGGHVGFPASGWLSQRLMEFLA
jgi:predicted alpha/beta-fold hydrolase